MNRQREVIVTVTYNELGIIVDAKAEPRKKGEWIDEGQYTEGHSEHAYYCSQCEKHYIGWIGEFNFCPNCGAEMSV